MKTKAKIMLTSQSAISIIERFDDVEIVHGYYGGEISIGDFFRGPWTMGQPIPNQYKVIGIETDGPRKYALVEMIIKNG